MKMMRRLILGARILFLFYMAYQWAVVMAGLHQIILILTSLMQ